MNCEFGKVDFIQVKDKDVINLLLVLKFKRIECGYLDRFINYVFYSYRSCM